MGTSAEASEELTVLVVADGERFASALCDRLEKHGLSVERASPESAAKAAFAAAPDLIVLAGRAAEDGGLDVLTALAERSVTATLPVVLVTSERRLDPKLSSFRHGVVAIVERTASADEMARRIASVAREMPDRPGEAAGTLAEASVDELVELFAESLRTGILSVNKGGESAQVLLRPDRPVSEAIQQLVERLRPLLSASGELRYEFHESPPSRIAEIDLGSLEGDGSLTALRDRRILVIEQNAPRSDILAQELRSAGALVVIADGTGSGLELARTLTPDIVVVDGSGIEGWALEAFRQIRRDIWLRWASILLVEAEKLWRNPRRPDVGALARAIERAVRPDRELANRVMKQQSIEMRLEVIGPLRMLRALAETKLGLRVTMRHPRLAVEVDLADGLVAGASARAGTAPVEGTVALTTFFGLSSGRVTIAHAAAPKSANVMAPPDDAFARALLEEPAIAPSLPPPSIALSRAGESTLPARGEDLEGLLGRLETLLGQIKADELPPIDAVEEDTGLYDARIVERLRSKMRRSSQRLPAVAEQEKQVPSDPPPAVVKGRPAQRPPALQKTPASPIKSVIARTPQQLPRVEPKLSPLEKARAGLPPKRAPRDEMPTPAMVVRPSPSAKRTPEKATPVVAQAAVSVVKEETPEPIATAQEAAISGVQEKTPEPAAPEEHVVAPSEPVEVVPQIVEVVQESAPAIEEEPAPPPAAERPLPVKRSPRAQRTLSIALFVTPIVLVIIGVAVYAAMQGSPEPRARAPVREVRETPQPPAPTPEPVAVEPAPEPELVGPRAGEPLEGRGEDFDLAALGVTPSPAAGALGADRLLKAANTARARERYDEADAQYRNVLAIDPENPRATAGMARVALERGDPARAVLFAQRLVRLRAYHPGNYVLLGDALLAAENRDAARRSFEAALGLDPRYSAARERLDAL